VELEVIWIEIDDYKVYNYDKMIKIYIYFFMIKRKSYFILSMDFDKILLVELCIAQIYNNE